MRRLVLVVALMIPAAALAKKAKPARASSANARAISELGGKFKWGMSPDDVVKIIAATIHEKYVEPVKQTRDVYEQDQLRKKEAEEVQQVRESLIKFEGQKTGWDTSLIDKEFSQRNGESMLVMWEKDQRRFLFFYNDHLYKQFIAFNAEHPVFRGKSFDDFANLIQARYGHAAVRMAAMRTKDDVTLDHLEWPSAGEYTLWATDQSGLYGNFCLKLLQTSVGGRLEKERAERAPRQARPNAIIDAVTAPDTMKGDPNADIVDQIVGKKSTGETGTETARPAHPSSAQPAAQPSSQPAHKAPAKNDDPLAGMKF